MIFAAGLGTRLKPLTDTMPKALVRVGGQPLLYHVIQRLKNVGVERVVVNVHHFADQIVNYLSDNDNFGLDIRISDEREQLLETGGGIKKARPLFSPHSPILIHNVDIISNADLATLFNVQTSKLLVSPRQSSRHLIFNEDMRLVGWQNTATGEVKSPFPWLKQQLKEPSSKLQVQSFSGIHVFSPSLFPLMDMFPDRFSIIDFYLNVCDKADIQGIVKADLKLLDVGKLDTLSQAENLLQQL